MRAAVLFLNGKINLSFCEDYIIKHCKALPIYCADGAYNKVFRSDQLSHNILAIIGDKDSFSGIKAPSTEYELIKDQESSDFDKSLNFLYEKGYQKIIVFGAGGIEMDHYLGNVSSILHFQTKLYIILVDDYSYSFVLNKNMSINNIKDQRISIIPLFMLDRLTLQGCQYQLDEEILKFGSRIGIRNSAVSNEVKINYHRGQGLIFISHNKF